MAKNVTKTMALELRATETKSFKWVRITIDGQSTEIFRNYKTTFEYRYTISPNEFRGWANSEYCLFNKTHGIDIQRIADKHISTFLYKVSVPENIFIEYGGIWNTEADALRKNVISRVIGGENTYEASFIKPDNMTLSKADFTCKDEATAKKEAKAHAKSKGLMLVKVEIKPTTENTDTEVSIAKRYGMKHETFVSLAMTYGAIERMWNNEYISPSDTYNHIW